MTRPAAERLSKVLAGLLVAAAAISGIYAVAQTTATAAAASFAPETATRPRIAEFTSRAQRAAAEYRAARAKCKVLAGAARDTCLFEARAEEMRSVRDAHPL
jgi:hypothetical protein